MEKKFDVKKLEKLNNPKMLEYVNPDLVWNTLALGKAKTLVDIGAGTGVFAVRFMKKTANGKMYACDISDAMIDWMNENLPADARDSVVPVKMEESSVPLPDGMADLVYMINLHHELYEPEKVIAECHRLLKGGGNLMIIDWKKSETPYGPPVSIRVDADTIAAQMQKGGFSGVKVHGVLPYHSFVVGTKDKG
ncbi:MAG: class I SAM-dependent methyltransferase [Nitrospiraceae bacterium]|nr:class I SAM-dependent methyltransferase [Nitrospiraceae bacterium]